jgi:hypothetical protein
MDLTVIAKALPHSVGPVLATAGGLLLVAAQEVTATANESNLMTLVASVLASTGVVGYAVKKFVDNQIKRSQEDRAEDAEARRLAQANLDRLILGYEGQVSRWENLYKEERARNERLVGLMTGKPVSHETGPI